MTAIYFRKGQEWKRLREAVNFIMDPKFVEQYLPAQEEIAQDFAERISYIRNSRGEVQDFLPELYRFTEEGKYKLLLGKYNIFRVIN